MDHFQFFKDLYTQEIDRRHKLNSSIGLNVTGLVIYGSIIGSYIFNFDYSVNCVISTLFIILIVASGISIFISCYFFFRHYFGSNYKYKSLAKPTEFWKWREEEIKTRGEEFSEEIDKQFQNSLLERLIASTAHNIEINDKKAYQFHMGRRFLLITFIILMGSMGFYLFNSFNKSESPQKIEIINSKS